MSTTVLKSVTIDDGDANITYVPTGRWTVHTNVESIFHLYNNTDTFSDIQNATATVKFYGNAVEYWGNQGPYHGPCIVSVDGHQMTTVNSYATVDDNPILLFSSNNLTLGDHTLEVRVVNPSSPGNVCEVDRFVANITSGTSSGNGNGGGQSGGSNSGGSGGSSGNHGGGKSSTPIAAIAAGVAGGVALCVFLLGLWLCIRSRKMKPAYTANISKPLLLGDEPASPAPQTPSFYQTEYNPASYAPSSVGPLSSYNQPSTYNSGGLPVPVSVPPGVLYPHSTSSHYQNPSPSSTPMPEGPRSSIGPTSIVSSTNISTPSEPRYPPEKSPGFLYNTNYGAATTSGGPVESSSTNIPLSSAESRYPLEKGPGSSTFNADPAGSSTASPGPSSIGRQPIILTPDTAALSEMPPPAYDA